MQAGSERDTATLQQLFTRDCVVHMPGSHPLAGEHKGLDAVLDLVRRMHEETNGVSAEPQQLFVDDRGHAIGMYRFTAERRGRRHDVVSAAHFTFVGDRIAGIEVYEQDLDGMNQFWS
jgi:ketosteroid isomerase-like protein